MPRFYYSFLATLLLVSTNVHAQQEPQFTHFTWNQFVFNPAVAGSQDSLFATALYHNQWVAFSGPDEEGAPVTKTVSLHSRLGKKIGIGAHGIYDEEGFITTAASYVSGAYHFKLRFADLGIGVSAGMLQKSIDPRWRPRDPLDPRLPGNASDITFDAGAGMRIQGENWYVGASSLHVNRSKLTWKTATGEIHYRLQRAYWFNGAYTWSIGEKFDLTPAALVKTDFAKTQYAANLQALYKKSVFLGVNYRDEVLTAASIMGGFYIKKKLALGYSFDIPTRDFSIFGGTHEVMLQYRSGLSSFN